MGVHEKRALRLALADGESDPVGASDPESVAVSAGLPVRDGLAVQVRDPVGRGVAEGLQLRVGEAEAGAVPEAVAVGLGLRVGVGLGLGLGDRDAARDGDVDAVGPPVVVPDADGEAVREVVQVSGRVAVAVGDGAVRVRLAIGCTLAEGVGLPLRLPLVDRERLPEAVHVAVGARDSVRVRDADAAAEAVAVGERAGDQVRLRLRDAERARLGDEERVREREGEAVNVAVGTRVTVAVGLPDREAVCRGLPEGVALSEAEREAPRLALRVPDREQVRVLRGVVDEVGLAEREARALAEAVGEGDAEGVGWRERVLLRDGLGVRGRVAELAVGVRDAGLRVPLGVNVRVGTVVGLAERVGEGVGPGDRDRDTLRLADREQEKVWVGGRVVVDEAVAEGVKVEVGAVVTEALPEAVGEAGEREAEMVAVVEAVAVRPGLRERDPEGVAEGVVLPVTVAEAEAEREERLRVSVARPDSDREALALAELEPEWEAVRRRDDVAEREADRLKVREGTALADAVRLGLALGLHDGEREAEAEWVAEWKAEADAESEPLRLVCRDNEADPVPEWVRVGTREGLCDSVHVGDPDVVRACDALRVGVWLGVRCGVQDGVGEGDRDGVDGDRESDCEGVALPVTQADCDAVPERDADVGLGEALRLYDSRAEHVREGDDVGEGAAVTVRVWESVAVKSSELERDGEREGAERDSDMVVWVVLKEPERNVVRVAERVVEGVVDVEREGERVRVMVAVSV